jgi:hypothetical protein
LINFAIHYADTYFQSPDILYELVIVVYGDSEPKLFQELITHWAIMIYRWGSERGKRWHLRRDGMSKIGPVFGEQAYVKSVSSIGLVRVSTLPQEQIAEVENILRGVVLAADLGVEEAIDEESDRRYSSIGRELEGRCQDWVLQGLCDVHERLGLQDMFEICRKLKQAVRSGGCTAFDLQQCKGIIMEDNLMTEEERRVAKYVPLHAFVFPC